MTHFNFNKISYLLVFIFAFVASCTGQEKPKPPKKVDDNNTPFSFLEINTKLDIKAQIGEYFTDLLQDKNGNMWFGYSGGVFRLEGGSFINVTKNGPWK